MTAQPSPHTEKYCAFSLYALYDDSTVDTLTLGAKLLVFDGVNFNEFNFDERTMLRT